MELSDLARQTEAWDATETANRVSRGDVSTVEVVRAAVERARAMEPKINAIVYPMFEAGLAQAQGRSSGPFAGVPTFIKDMEDLAGTPTRYGSAGAPAYVAAKTAKSVVEYLSTGMIVIGKSSTSEFGLTATTEPTFGRPTCNPRNLRHTAGGSSGGAAALVAAGVVPIAHGGDGGGSIRIPASFCGLVGLKATRGRLAPMASAKRMPVNLVTYGVLTRSVRDTAAFFAAADVKVKRGMRPIGRVEGPGHRRYRIGLFIDPPAGTPVHPDVRKAVMATARRLEDQGHTVEPVAAPYDQQLVDDFLLHWGFLAAGIELAIGRSKDGDLAKLEPWTRHLARMARQNLRRLPGAIWRLRRFRKIYARSFRRCDLMLSPVTAAPAPQLGYLSGDQPYEGMLEKLLELLPYTPIQNASGAPAISLPVATAAGGLPVGVQLAAPWGEERRLLEMAYALESN